MGRRPTAMEFALAVNYLYYVWSVWFYTLPNGRGGSGRGDTWRWAARTALSRRRTKKKGKSLHSGIKNKLWIGVLHGVTQMQCSCNPVRFLSPLALCCVSLQSRWFWIWVEFVTHQSHAAVSISTLSRTSDPTGKTFIGWENKCGTCNSFSQRIPALDCSVHH